ncbi:MAG: autoinducer-2 kinase [Spirochaetales bacterium]|nr:autoinducer-2 kinase [Spirochaetales bacterium]
MENYLLAIDAGTGSIRAVIFDLKGNQISVGQREWIHKEDSRFPGSMDFDIENNYNLLILCIKEAIAAAKIEPEKIIAVASDSMREAIILYDSEGKEIWACANVDSRSVDEVSQLAKISEGIEKEIYEESGQTFSLGALARILWVKNNMPEVYEQTTAVTMLNDWVNYKLSGNLSVEPSNGCTTGMFDLASRAWKPEIAAKCGLKADIYPVVHESGTPVGKITEEISSITGLSRECLVVTGGGDAQIGSVGVGAVKKGQAALFGGSFWQLEYNVGTPKVDPEGRVRINCHVVSNQWQHEMIAFFPGLVMRWFRDGFCQLEKMIEKDYGIDAYSLTEKLALDVPIGSHGMLCSFSSVMDYSNWKHAAPCFTNFGIDPEKFHKGTFYRALMENAALVTLGHLKIINALNDIEIKEIVFASGASKSSLWCQIVSDVLGVKILVPKVKEAAALGTAICAGYGAGVYKSIEEAAGELVEIEATYTPDMENHKKYGEIYETWLKVNKSQMENSDKGFLNHMWKAPGL